MRHSKPSLPLAFLAIILLISSAICAEEPKNSAELQLMRGFPSEQDKLVTKANWLAPPFNRYAYQHTREIFPSPSAEIGSAYEFLATMEKKLVSMAESSSTLLR